MKEYIYPDGGDKLTTLFIEKDSDNEYWGESEKNILQMMINEIKEMPNKPKFLDLGCGMGRLFSAFYPYVESITGVDPDISRVNEALKQAEKIDSQKIKVLNGDITLVENNRYNVVLTSHIFQHMSLDTVKEIVSKLNKIIPKDGLLLITTTFSGKEKDILSIEYSKRNRRKSKRISERKFNKIISKQGFLPVRRFSINTIKEILESNGFSIEKKASFHFDKRKVKEGLSVELDNKLNELGKIKYAIDMMYICRKV